MLRLLGLKKDNDEYDESVKKKHNGSQKFTSSFGLSDLVVHFFICEYMGAVFSTGLTDCGSWFFFHRNAHA